MQQRKLTAPDAAVTWTERAGRATMTLLIALACLTIFLPLLLTLYLSLFDEQMIVFPPHAYTLAWYPRIAASFGAPIWNSLRIALAAVALSPADRHPRRHRPVPLPLPRPRRRQHPAARTPDHPRHRHRPGDLRPRRLDRGTNDRRAGRLHQAADPGPRPDHHALGRPPLPRQPHQPRAHHRGSRRQPRRRPADGDLARHPAGHALRHHRRRACSPSSSRSKTWS